MSTSKIIQQIGLGLVGMHYRRVGYELGKIRHYVLRQEHEKHKKD